MRNSKREHITSSAWPIESDAPLSGRRKRVILARVCLLLCVILLGVMASYIPFSNFVIATGFILCTLTIMGCAVALLIKDHQREEQQQSTYESVPTTETMNELMSSAAMIATARNITQRV